MIAPDYVRTMCAYNAEMNRRVYAASARLTDAQRREQHGVFWGSLHGTLNHLLWADRIWMSRFAGWPKPERSLRESANIIEDFGALTAAREQLDADLSAWAETLEPEWLYGELAWFSAVAGGEVRRGRALLVVHMFNHQTHHRGQAHAVLTRLGEKVGDTDLPFVLPA